MRTAASVGFASLLWLASACDKVKKEQLPPVRAELREMTGDTFEIIPTSGQFPYCLIFTRSESGVVRQLTMTHGNRSVACEPGKPIGGVRYRVPTNEGRVKIHVFFSDQRLSAASIAQDLYERKGDPSFQPMDLRLPGKVYVQTFEFHPQPPTEETSGVRIGAGGQLEPPRLGASGAGGMAGGAADAGAGTDAGTQ
jgi:hypothetical protein